MQAKEEVIFTIIVVILVLVFLAILFLVFLARNNNRKNRLLFENERIKKDFEQTLLNTRLEIQEQTLNHVSREIHDNIGQTLSLARLQLNSWEESSAETEATDELLGKAIADLRVLSHSLNTNHIKEKGFTESIKELLDQFKKTGKFNVEFINENRNFDLPDENGLIVFRVIQEILNNITKHAEANVIRVVISENEDEVKIKIEDNGRGFDIESLQEKEKGIGIRNITDRIRIIGGKLSINSQIHKGTKIKISLPHAKTIDKSSTDR